MDYSNEPKSHPFLSNFSPPHLQELLTNSSVKSFNAGDQITFTGSDASQFYLILSGAVNVMAEKFDRAVDREPTEVAIQTLCAGETLGWSWIIPPHQWSFDTYAAEDVEVLALDGNYIRNECELDPAMHAEVLKRILNIVKERLVATRLQLALHEGKPFTEVEGG